jgi:hypothetical protein
LYPNGDENSKGYIGLYLIMLSATSKNFLAKWDFDLLNEAGNSLRTENGYERRGETLAAENGLGSRRFMSHEEFLKKAKDCERITVVCKVRVTKKICHV